MKKRLILLFAALALFALCLAACTPSATECSHVPSGDITITKQSTCTEGGERSYTCKKCGETVAEALPAKGHVEITAKGYASTCVRHGVADAVKCQTCGITLSGGEELPFGEHTPTSYPAVDPTCYQEGTTACTKCSTCGELISGGEPIAKAAHTGGVEVEHCSKTGDKCYACSTCGKFFQDESCSTPYADGWQPTSHNYGYESHSCSTCGKAMPTYEDYLRSLYESANAAKLATVNAQNVLSATAYAYYAQGSQIYYDQNIYRRNVNMFPEDATSYQRAYLDCSSYVDAVYNYVFGTNVINNNPRTKTYCDYCRDNQDSPDVIYYVQTADYATAEARKALLQEIRSNLQVGDLVVYRHGKSTSSLSGHLMMYVGNNTFLHSTGNSISATAGSTNPEGFYDRTSDAEKNGTVMVLSADDVFTDRGTSRYLFANRNGDKTFYFGVLRPTNSKFANTEMTERSVSRYVLANLQAEKSSSVAPFTSVTRGSKITYTVTLTNTGKEDYNGVYVKETIPQGVQLDEASDCATLDGNDLYFEIGKVAAGQTVTVYYTYQVSATVGELSAIVDGETYLVDIPLNSIVHQVENAVDRTALGTALRGKVGTDATSVYSLMADLVATELPKASKAFTSTYKSASDVLGEMYSSTNTLNKDSNAFACNVYGLYGGLKTGSKLSLDNVRCRAVVADYLQCGDVISAYTSYNGGSYKELIFVDSSLILQVSGGKVVAAYDTQDKVSNFLMTLYAYDCYAVTRPSLISK